MMKANKILPPVRFCDKRVLISRILVVLLMLANLTFVWFNSAQTADDSTEISRSVTRSVAPHVIDGYNKLSDKEKEAKVKELNPKMRCIAHSLEYVPLGILLFLLMLSVFETGKKLKTENSVALLLLSLLLAFLFALTDEIHQIFVDGRSFEMKDIGLDMLGMAVGYVLAVLSFKVYKLCRK